MERRRQWLRFVSRENEDGSPWQPADGDRICSAHFILGKKSEGAGDPDFVPSVYPKTASKKRPGSSEAANVQSVARYKRVKQRSAAKEIAEQETKEKEVVRRKEEERNSIVIQYMFKAFQHDHGSYCNRSNNSTLASVIPSSCSLYLQSSRSGEEGAICAEVGKSFVK